MNLQHTIYFKKKIISVQCTIHGFYKFHRNTFLKLLPISSLATMASNLFILALRSSISKKKSGKMLDLPSNQQLVINQLYLFLIAGCSPPVVQFVCHQQQWPFHQVPVENNMIAISNDYLPYCTFFYNAFSNLKSLRLQILGRNWEQVEATCLQDCSHRFTAASGLGN